MKTAEANPNPRHRMPMSSHVCGVVGGGLDGGVGGGTELLVPLGREGACRNASDSACKASAAGPEPNSGRLDRFPTIVAVSTDLGEPGRPVSDSTSDVTERLDVMRLFLACAAFSTASTWNFAL